MLKDFLKLHFPPDYLSKPEVIHSLIELKESPIIKVREEGVRLISCPQKWKARILHSGQAILSS